jgi:sulfur-oxidizing protein SoxY
MLAAAVALTMPPVSRWTGSGADAQATPHPPIPSRFLSIEEKVDETIKRVFDGRPIKYTDSLALAAPHMAENGKVVPIEVKFDRLADPSGSTHVKQLFVIVDNNRRPLSIAFVLKPGAMSGYAGCNLRMGETSPVRAIVEMSDGQLFGAVQNVNVVVGGCGG